MYIINNIAYAGEKSAELKVSGIRPLENHKLWLRFNTGEIKIFDFVPLLDSPAFTPIKNEALFKQVYIDYGIPCWNDGEIDIAPEFLYKNSVISENLKTT